VNEGFEIVIVPSPPHGGAPDWLNWPMAAKLAFRRLVIDLPKYSLSHYNAFADVVKGNNSILTHQRQAKTGGQ